MSHYLCAGDSGDNFKDNFNNGLTCEFWGPPMWFTLHAIMANFRVENKQAYQHFIRSLGDVLPCGKCRASFKAHIQDIERKPEYNLLLFASRRVAMKFMFDLHNCVNKSINKPVLPDSQFDEVNAMYERGRAGNSKILRSIVLLQPLECSLKKHPDSILIHESCLL